VAYEELAAASADADPQLARDLFQAIGEAVMLHAQEESGDEAPEVGERLRRLRAFRDALALRLPVGT
jgi:hypothetical protein